MAGPFYFAWVEATDTTFSSDFAREDEDVFEFEVEHSEGDFPTAKLLIRNPRVGLLEPGRKQWAWIARDFGDTAGPIPLFFGRITGQPISLGQSVIEVALRARPGDLAEQKEAVAAPLRVSPYFDPLWIRPELRDDPEVVLESRPVLWHYDRTSPVVTLSSIIDGEDGVETFTDGDFLAESLSVSIGTQALKSVSVEADVSWTQRAVGEVDMSQRLVDLFHSAGSQKAGLISSFTGQGLWDSFPGDGDDIGAGWFTKSIELSRADGISVPLEYSKTKFKFKEEPDPKVKNPPHGFAMRFALWQIRARLIAGYDTTRQRNEKVRFTMSADVQPLWTDQEDSESELLTFSSNEVGELIDNEGTSTTPPIEDFKRRQFFPTDRGLRSLEYLMTVARAHLISRGRAVQVSIEIPFARAVELSCRKNATILSDDLPGGQASGKIVSYSFAMKDGEETGSVTIACSVGRGNSVAGAAGSHIYDDDYSQDDFSELSGNVSEVITGELTYIPPTDPPIDDGIDFNNLTADNCLLLAEMMQGGETAQRTILAQKYRLASEVVETLNNAYTRWRFVFIPLNGKSFEQTYSVTVSQQMIPKTIDLESA
jgi:hypothetical protein